MKKLLYALLSLVIAMALWAYVITTERPGSEATFYNIPVVLQNESVLLDRGLMLSQDRNMTVSLKLSGNRSNLVKLDSNNITVTVDLAKVYRAGKQSVSYSISYPGAVSQNAIDVISSDPQEISLNVVERRTKEVPVEPVYSGSVPEGYLTDKENVILDHKVIVVTGPASVVDTIQKAVINVDLEGVTDTIDQVYAYTLCDAEGNQVESELLTTDTPEVSLVLTVQRYKEIQLELSVIPGGGATLSNTQITMDTESIQISGTEQLLAEVGSKLNIGTLNLGELQEDGTVEFKINLPDGITNLSGQEKVTVTVHFGDLVMKQIQITDIRQRNVPAGMKVEILTKLLTVTVRGSRDQVNAITASDMNVMVDFTSAEVGTGTYKALIYVDSTKFGTVGALGSYIVSATVASIAGES